MSIGPHAVIGPGARIKESIVLAYSKVLDHSLVLYTIIGRVIITYEELEVAVIRFVTGSNSEIGCWTRVEGTPCDPNPDKPFAKMENAPLFNDEGRLNPSITILGKFLYFI